jgi:hypothetical protein
MMRITEAWLRNTIREILLEDLAGFIGRTKDITYVGDLKDPTFSSEYSKSQGHKAQARSVKQAWAAEVDREFIDSLVKVHWLKDVGVRESLARFLNMSRNNEIATMGYLPDADLQSNWGTLGVVVKGFTTLAANDMNAIRSGYAADIPPEIASKQARSGTRKRPTSFHGGTADSGRSREYILDDQSFNRAKQGSNEFILANWEPVAVVLSTRFRENKFEPLFRRTREDIEAAFNESGLPAHSAEDTRAVSPPRKWSPEDVAAAMARMAAANAQSTEEQQG